MGPPSYMRSVVDRNVVMRRVTVFQVEVKFRVILGQTKSILAECE